MEMYVNKIYYGAGAYGVAWQQKSTLEKLI